MTHPRSVEDRLRDMLDAANEAIGFAEARTRADLEGDRMFQHAVTHLVELIGEAAKHVPDDYRALHPDVPWRIIAGMRDRLAHRYFDVDLDVLWSTVSTDLPGLASQLEAILQPGAT